MVKKILYTYAYHIVYYLRKCEAFHEITDFVHEMLSECAPLECIALRLHVELLHQSTTTDMNRLRIEEVYNKQRDK